MQYTIIDEQLTKAQALEAQAVAAEQAAFQAECTALERKELAKTFPGFEEEHDTANLRTEANKFVKASKLSRERISQIHKDFLTQWIATIESNHAGHAAIVEVRGASTPESQAHQTTMEQLEVAHKVALNLLKDESAKDK